MSGSVNKVIILGNLTKDPELRYSANGNAVANMSIATNRKWKDKQGEVQEEAEFHRLVAYDRIAEVAGEYLEKGRQVYIEGRLKTRKWEDKEGVTRYTTEIVVDSMTLLGSRRDNGGGEQPPRHATKRPAKDPAKSGGGGFDDMDDDVPF